MSLSARRTIKQASRLTDLHIIKQLSIWIKREILSWICRPGGKGMVWVNGHAMGRFWEIGPQQTLYMPGCWLKEGDNEIIVLDLKGPAEAKVVGVEKTDSGYAA